MFENIWVIIWATAVVAFVVAELVTATFSFFAWLAVGAAVSGVLAYKDWGGPEIQIIAFLTISSVLILATRAIQKKYAPNKAASMDTKERIVGKRVQVVEDINNFKEAGKVYLEGSYWRARSYNDDEIYEKEQIVTVIDVEGIVLIVKK